MPPRHSPSPYIFMSYGCCSAEQRLSSEYCMKFKSFCSYLFFVCAMAIPTIRKRHDRSILILLLIRHSLLT